MARLPVQSFMLIAPLCAVFGSTALYAAVSASADATASISIVEQSGAVTQQEAVIGSVAVPILTNIGVSAGGIAPPLPTGISGLGQFRIGTESLARDVGRVVSQAGLQQASFTIIGDQDQVISIAVPSTVSLSQLSGDGEVEFSPVTSMTGNGESRLVASADGSGTLEFDVGGSLKPSSLAIAGDYAGVLRVTVQYN